MTKKNYPLDFEESELINEINRLIKDSTTKVLSPGQKESLIFKIELGQLYLNSIENKKINSELRSIINNNKKTSRISIILSIFMLLLAISTLYKSLFNSENNHLKSINDFSKIQAKNSSKIHSNVQEINVVVKEINSNLEEIETNKKTTND